jgi:hypothetical protein
MGQRAEENKTINHKCRDCGRQFVEDPQWQLKDKDIIILEEARESYRGNLELHPRIQPTNHKGNGDCITRSIIFLCLLQEALPKKVR